MTKYTYIVGGEFKEGQIDKETYRAANVGFDYRSKGSQTRIYFVEQSGYHSQKDGDGRLHAWADNGKILTVYAFGEPLSEPLVWKCYEDGGVEDREEIDGKVSLINTESMTFEEFALASFDEERGVTRVDWYNAVIGSIEDCSHGYTLDIVDMDRDAISSPDRFMQGLLRWYEYEITIPPHQSIVNTVSAPVYPSVNSAYEPPIFSYAYLLSPASTWASFGKLEIIINTPYYVTESSIDGFARTTDGYSLTIDGLPDVELEFTLSTSETPIAPSSWRYPSARTIAKAVGIFVLGVAAVITVVVTVKKKRG